MSGLLRYREVLLAAIIVAMVLGIGAYAPIFLARDSLLGVLNDTAFLFMMALAQAVVILTRGIDLSVAANLALDRLRATGRRRRVELTDAAGGGSRSGEPAAVDRLELARLLESLPRRQREVVVMRYLADRSEADTAEALGTSVGSVKRHAHRGLATLRTAWAGLDADPLVDTGGV